MPARGSRRPGVRQGGRMRSRPGLARWTVQSAREHLVASAEPTRSREVPAVSRPTATSPGQERIVNQSSEIDQPCKGNDAILRERAGNNKDQEDEPLFTITEEWHTYAPIQGQCRLRRFRAAGPGNGRLRLRRSGSGKRHEGCPGPGPAGGQSRHKVAHGLMGQERGAADEHDQAERPHPEARADAHVQHNGPGQHQRAQAGSPDRGQQKKISQRTDRRGSRGSAARGARPARSCRSTGTPGSRTPATSPRRSTTTRPAAWRCRRRSR